MSHTKKALSKSRLLSFRQCPLRLWNEVHRRDQKTEPDGAAQARFDNGNRVGELAQQRWPGGVLIDAEYWDIDTALKQTQVALNDPETTAIYEACFVAYRTSVRVDVLVRVGLQEWELWEVKSVLNPKEIHSYDYAVQLAVTRAWAAEQGHPLTIRRGGILHLNRDYVFDGVAYDCQTLFAEHDLTAEVGEFHDEVQQAFVTAAAVVDNETPPTIQPGNHCGDPYVCPFLGTACAEPPLDELFLLPRIRASRVEDWHTSGIDRLDQLDPEADGLNPVQARVWQAHMDGALQVVPGLRQQVEAIGYPRYHLDFESTGSWMALPRWKGTRPFQPVPFQFSLHLERAPGQLVLHDGYLHCDASDPRRPVAEALIQQTSIVPGPILTYSGYEKQMISQLIDASPDLEPDLEAIRARFVDLLPIVRDHVYHPDFGGSFSIKQVLPALVDDLSYEGLGIADGDTAALSYLEMIDLLSAENATPDQQARAAKIRQDLWLYCKRDTEAMVALMARLEELANNPG
ncbi:DUF2779 domain-containing protein [bacterium]|nr:DUF2779 domain-containing protein [bacterium]